MWKDGIIISWEQHDMRGQAKASGGSAGTVSHAHLKAGFSCTQASELTIDGQRMTDGAALG